MLSAREPHCCGNRSPGAVVVRWQRHLDIVWRLGSEPRSKDKAQLPTSVISLPPFPSPFLPSLPHLPSFFSEMLLFAWIIVADPSSSLPHGLCSPGGVYLLLREVYRVTESLQREKSGLLKQLDFLRWVCQGLLPCLYSGTALYQMEEYFLIRTTSPKIMTQRLIIS